MSLIEWQSEQFCISIRLDEKRHAWLDSLRLSNTRFSPHDHRQDVSLPLVEVRTIEEGAQFGTSERLVWSALSRRLIYITHLEEHEDDEENLSVTLEDPQTKLRVVVRFCGFKSIPVLRCFVDLENRGDVPLYVQAISSLALGNLSQGSQEWWDDFILWKPQNTNFREAQWHKSTLPDLGIEYAGSCDFGQPGSRASCIVSNKGTFSTNGHLPMGALERKDGQLCYMWQIESSGAWRWEVGDMRNSLYLLAGGPSDQDCQWVKRLDPGSTFRSVPTAIALVNKGHQAAIQALTQYRRRIRRAHQDNKKMSLIFNDYMNCLMGEPTEEKIASLIEPAADCGAEYFVIDAGWYGEPNVSWWDTVGAWEPNPIRFPSGLKATTTKIRKAGMIPGLWLEPEVIGVNSPIANEIPPEAYFQRYGHRIIEQGRFQLDFRHKDVRRRLDLIVDRLVYEFDVGYFKFDYNIDVTQGTDIGCTSPGDGLLEHRRAYMGWINALYDRHPDLVIESCSSGGQRLDYELLATHSLQSTSDQEDAVLYAAIAASIPTAVTPEQSATWAYPQPSWSAGLITLTVVNSLLGRVHLSGRLDKLNDAQFNLVQEGMVVYKQIRYDLSVGLPFWPLGLPHWTDDWLMLGISIDQCAYIAAWRRGGETSCDAIIQLPNLLNKRAEVIYPSHSSSKSSIDRCSLLKVTLPEFPSACLIRLD